MAKLLVEHHMPTPEAVRNLLDVQAIIATGNVLYGHDDPMDIRADEVSVAEGGRGKMSVGGIELEVRVERYELPRLKWRRKRALEEKTEAIRSLMLESELGEMPLEVLGGRALDETVLIVWGTEVSESGWILPKSDAPALTRNEAGVLIPNTYMIRLANASRPVEGS